MKIENAHTSLELSKRLRDLGVRQESAFYWAELFMTKDMVLVQPTAFSITSPEPRIAAFSVAELGEMLPFEVQGSTLDYWKDCDDQWRVYFESLNFKMRISELNEAEARGLMLEHLIKEGIVKIEEINRRISE